MEDVVRIYDRLLADVRTSNGKHSIAAAARPRTRPTPSERLADPAAEELRLVLYGPDSPAVPSPTGTREGLVGPGRSPEAERGSKAKVNELKVNSPASPPRAMVVLDAPQPINPRVFMRGNPGRPGKPVPRQFLRIVAGDERQAVQEGLAAGWNWPKPLSGPKTR